MGKRERRRVSEKGQKTERERETNRKGERDQEMKRKRALTYIFKNSICPAILFEKKNCDCSNIFDHQLLPTHEYIFVSYFWGN